MAAAAALGEGAAMDLPVPCRVAVLHAAGVAAISATRTAARTVARERATNRYPEAIATAVASSVPRPEYPPSVALHGSARKVRARPTYRIASGLAVSAR